MKKKAKPMRYEDSLTANSVRNIVSPESASYADNLVKVGHTITMRMPDKEAQR